MIKFDQLRRGRIVGSAIANGNSLKIVTGELRPRYLSSPLKAMTLEEYIAKELASFGNAQSLVTGGSGLRQVD